MRKGKGAEHFKRFVFLNFELGKGGQIGSYKNQGCNMSGGMCGGHMSLCIYLYIDVRSID